MPSRRAVLVSAAIGVAALAGCAGTGTTDDETTTTEPTEKTSSSSERVTETTRDRAEDDTEYDRVVMENRTSEEHVVWVAVEQDGERLHEGTYRVPIETGLRIERQFDWGTHTVRASVDGGEERTREWEHGSCANTPYPDGNMNLGVVTEDEEGWSFLKNVCDYRRLGGVYVAEYESASEHEVETTTTAGTATTSTTETTSTTTTTNTSSS